MNPTYVSPLASRGPVFGRMALVAIPGLLLAGCAASSTGNGAPGEEVVVVTGSRVSKSANDVPPPGTVGQANHCVHESTSFTSTQFGDKPTSAPACQRATLEIILRQAQDDLSPALSPAGLTRHQLPTRSIPPA